MKKLACIMLLLIMAGLANAQVYVLQISVSQVESNQGNLLIGIFNDSKSFPKKGRAFRDLVVPARSPVSNVRVELPAGTYSICVCHDSNANGECDTNFLGYPSEAFGFSNNIRPVLSAPSFRETSIQLTKNENIEIKIKR